MKAATVLVPLLLAGCAAPQLRVTYTSDPPGATLYQDGTPLGYTPYTMVYQDARWAAGSCMRTRPIAVKWVSGAEAGGQQIYFCPSQGNNLTYGFSRPDAPGRELDAQMGMQLHQSRVAADAQVRSAAAMALGAQLLAPPQPAFAPVQMPPPMQPVAQPPRPINCTTTRMGAYLNTSCY